jgi:hypothetical protein
VKHISDNYLDAHRRSKVLPMCPVCTRSPARATGHGSKEGSAVSNACLRRELASYAATSRVMTETRSMRVPMGASLLAYGRGRYARWLEHSVASMPTTLSRRRRNVISV